MNPEDDAPRPDCDNLIDWQKAKSDQLYRNRMVDSVIPHAKAHSGRFGNYIKRLQTIQKEAEIMARRRVSTNRSDTKNKINETIAKLRLTIQSKTPLLALPDFR